MLCHVHMNVVTRRTVVSTTSAHSKRIDVTRKSCHRRRRCRKLPFILLLPIWLLLLLEILKKANKRTQTHRTVQHQTSIRTFTNLLRTNVHVCVCSRRSRNFQYVCSIYMCVWVCAHVKVMFKRGTRRLQYNPIRSLHMCVCERSRKVEWQWWKIPS